MWPKPSSSPPATWTLRSGLTHSGPTPGRPWSPAGTLTQPRPPRQATGSAPRPSPVPGGAHGGEGSGLFLPPTPLPQQRDGGLGGQQSGGGGHRSRGGAAELSPKGQRVPELPLPAGHRVGVSRAPATTTQGHLPARRGVARELRAPPAGLLPRRPPPAALTTAPPGKGRAGGLPRPPSLAGRPVGAEAVTLRPGPLGAQSHSPGTHPGLLSSGVPPGGQGSSDRAGGEGPRAAGRLTWASSPTARSSATSMGRRSRGRVSGVRSGLLLPHKPG